MLQGFVAAMARQLKFFNLENRKAGREYNEHGLTPFHGVAPSLISLIKCVLGIEKKPAKTAPYFQAVAPTTLFLAVIIYPL